MVGPDGPVNPFAPTGVPAGHGRMKHRGERKCVDAGITATTPDGQRWVALVDPSDGRGWSTPGGGLYPGEHVREACTRETREESGLDISPFLWTPGAPRYVDDDRADDGAWPVTVLCRHDYGTVDTLPPLQADSDARRAAWARAGTYVELVADITGRLGGVEARGHRYLLADLLQTDSPTLLVA